MNILAMDTSGKAASVAVLRDGFLTGEIILRHGKTHSQKIVPMMDTLLKMLDIEPADIDLAAVANGPGSFTGLRIGVVTIKAFAYALNIPVAEVSTLMALAFTLGETDGVVCPIQDARNRQVFTGVYRVEKEWAETLHEDAGMSIEDLTAVLKTMNTKVHFIGDAVPLYRDFISEQGINACFADDEMFTPRASAVS
jgi:tRNA threonylcarbamoyladenosine biosynthesis protein TsaB